MRNLKNTERNYIWADKQRIYLNNPKPHNFSIEAIARGTSRLCRFYGQTKIWYSVASHSIVVCDCCPPHLKLAGLLHDGDEGYLSDLSRPLKYIPEIYKVFKPIEHKFMKAISKQFKFKYNAKIRKTISEIEKAVVLGEIRDLIELPDDECIDLSQAISYVIDREVSPKEAEQAFISKYYEVLKYDR